jgi:hypothetical protein
MDWYKSCKLTLNLCFVYMNETIEEEVELYKVNSAWWKMEDEKLKRTYSCGHVGISLCKKWEYLVVDSLSVFVNYKI